MDQSYSQHKKPFTLYSGYGSLPIVVILLSTVDVKPLTVVIFLITVVGKVPSGLMQQELSDISDLLMIFIMIV